MTPNAITITYVTVCYNAADVIGRTLDSVLRQDYPYITHLVVDGASTDATQQLVADYAARSNATTRHDVHITSEPDHGVYDAMNKGLRSATGDYVCFLNAGDFLPAADTVSRIVAQLTAQPLPSAIHHRPATPHHPLPAVLYGDTDVVDAEGRYLHPRHLLPPERLTWRSFRHGMLVCHQAFYARTDFAVATPYDTRYRFSADVDWCIRIMRQAEAEQVPLHNLHLVVACYTEQGLSTRYHRQSLQERFSVMHRHYGLLTTVAMHAWFVVRALRRKIAGRGGR